MTTPTVLNIHPKVWTGALTGLAVTVVTAVASSLDPTLFDFLPVAYRAAAVLLVGTVLSAVAAWLKRSEPDNGDADAETGQPAEAADPAADTPATPRGV